MKQHLKEILKSLSPEIRNITLKAWNNVPSKLWSKPASSSGKYHPKFSSEGKGLLKHTLLVVKIADILFESVSMDFCKKEKELLLSAALLHDCMKYGVKFEGKWWDPSHPLLINGFFDKVFGDEQTEEHKLIVSLINCHHGKWNKDYKTKKITSLLFDEFGKSVDLNWNEIGYTTRKRMISLAKMLHQADMVASRRHLFDFIDEIRG